MPRLDPEVAALAAYLVIQRYAANPPDARSCRDVTAWWEWRHRDLRIARRLGVVGAPAARPYYVSPAEVL